jgi:hypothetical protein
MQFAERTKSSNHRSRNWHDNFEIRSGYIIGITPCGRGTLRLLDMNNELRLNHRRKLIEQQEFDVT